MILSMRVDGYARTPHKEYILLRTHACEICDRLLNHAQYTFCLAIFDLLSNFACHDSYDCFVDPEVT
jgi:hypothetical protein